MICGCCIICLSHLSAQENSQNQKNFTLRGIVIGQKKPLEFATVSLYQAWDNQLLQGVITDEKGYFEIHTKQGDYYLEITFLSFQPKEIKPIPFEQNNSVIDFGFIKLSPSSEILTQVEVVGEKKHQQIGLDKKIFHLDKNLNTRGSNIENALGNLPSITVDLDGRISLRGNQGVRILVNGKTSNLVGDSALEALGKLPASMVERVEVITNPSARYSAEGQGGIINIILRKDKKQGFNGTVDWSLTHPKGYGGALNLNLQKNKWNFFSNIGLSDIRKLRKGKNQQTFFDADSIFSLKQDLEQIEEEITKLVQLGGDFRLSESITLSLAGGYAEEIEENITNVWSTDFDKLEQTLGQNLRKEDKAEFEIEKELEFDFKKSFEKEGQILALSFEYETGRERETSDFDEEWFEQDGKTIQGSSLLQRGYTDEKVQEWSLEGQYVHPLKGKNQLEFGFITSLNDRDNEFALDEREDQGPWVAIPWQTNHFRYRDRNYALYGILNKGFKRLSTQIGLRLERTELTTLLLLTNQQFEQKYLNLFPSLHLSYEVNNHSSVNLSYSRRIRRPRFRDLNPFLRFSNARNARQGNPNLQPQFTNVVELGYKNYLDKVSTSTSVYYQHTTNVIQNINTFENGLTISKPQNLSERRVVGLEADIAIELNDWWSVNGGINGFYSTTSGQLLEENLKNDILSWQGFVNQQFVFTSTFRCQWQVQYRGPRENIQGRRASQFFTNLGFSKAILKKRATLSLNIQDLFNSFRLNSSLTTADFYQEESVQWQSRRIILNFVYQLNRTKKAKTPKLVGPNERDLLD